MKKLLMTLGLCLVAWGAVQAQPLMGTRTETSLNIYQWRTVMDESDPEKYAGFEQPEYPDADWKTVTIPHNWDQYEGLRQLRHGNLHGYAWYRTEFWPEGTKDQRFFLYFEGVGSYATVYVNGQKAGYHAGGRTTFTLDVTDLIRYGEANLLAVRADHPALIADLPWVCGGCSSEWGFSEGSQPLGIFRPVTLIATDPLRIEPFGVHIWNDKDVTPEKAVLHARTEIKNYGSSEREFTLLTEILDKDGNTVGKLFDTQTVASGETVTISQTLDAVEAPQLWSPENPYLYTLSSHVICGERIVDEMVTPFGIRTISWHLNRDDGSTQFKINGNPLLLNGVGEYEHLMGRSHAFTDQMIDGRVSQITAAGFNAFRDAHQPHNLRYNKHWDELGIMWWTQMSAHIWYDTPEFRENFKNLLRDFVKERRNSPSLIIWGLQNESMLPEDFAQECTEIIREMDPTTSSQRIVTTCNGGSGTDWNVIQNWSGTYGGDPYNYAHEISHQLLNGEYGAWRSIDWHSEGEYDQNGPLTEDRMTLLMEMKVRQIHEAADSAAGQFFWIFNSHENPGRIQNGEAYRDMDRVGPVNYKGLLTPWGEPLDVFYMYRSNYTDPEREPMVYIVSQTWPDRWLQPGTKSGIRIYSNCEEVELFNGLNSGSLGRKPHSGITGTHFIWDDVEIEYNVLTAVGYLNGQPVATDRIFLHHLPEAPDTHEFFTGTDVTLPWSEANPKSGDWNYVYRVNCGGPDYIDRHGNLWMADRHKKGEGTWGYTSWADDFPGIPPHFGSQRRSRIPLRSGNWPLLQTIRYGTDKLGWEFPVENGEYTVCLFINEPWYTKDHSIDWTNWRVFDIAVNDSHLRNVDISKYRSYGEIRYYTFPVEVNDGKIKIHFPNVASGQAVISAIAILTQDMDAKPAPPSADLMTVSGNGWKWNSWLDTGDKQFQGDNPVKFATLPTYLYGSEWINPDPTGAKAVDLYFSDSVHVYIACERESGKKPFVFQDFEPTGDSVMNGNRQIYDLYTRKAGPGDKLSITKKQARRISHVFAQYIADMGEEPSARPVVKLEAEEGYTTGPIDTGTFRNARFVKLTDPDNVIEWEVSPGLAATYLIRFRYMNHSEKPIPMQFEIVNALNGVVMRSDRIEFEPADEKWRIMSTTTGSQINAGTYKLILRNLETTGLELDYIEFE